MADIQHTLNINAPAESVYRALSTINGLASWWTSTTTGASAPGEVIDFRFNAHVVRMRVDQLERNKAVAWTCVDDGGDWNDTRIKFDLTEKDGRTTVRFSHRAWKEANDHMSHCSMKWATFLLSLREVAETGKGRPFPHDLSI
ncbi:MAG: SRPBCC domain-containing protein [Myxococcota bacterium]|nr:SRPBCC domain-containing protein [Myxococcota bacterium]